MSGVTQILGAMQQGDPKAAEELLPLVYQELRNLAGARMANEVAAHTLQPTALVHEAWLRLVAAEEQTWQNRAHFFGAAAEAMRRILIENARHKRALRCGGGQQRVDIEKVEIAAPAPEDELIALNEALEKFTVVDAPKAELVKLRYFVGLTAKEAAEVLNISVPTADRWWAYARAWLFKEITAHRGG